ncbi:MAG: CoA-binding protein, partial [Candidatus Bathyarchaeota archaeon]
MSEKETIKNLLREPKTVAIVGVSRDSTKDSYQVAEYLKAQGYTIVPINPFADNVLGMKCYKSLVDLPDELQKTIDIVDIFRPAEAVPSIVD